MQAHRLDLYPGRDILLKYRNVFSAKEGPAVLAHMLFEMGVFMEIPGPSPEDVALKNYGARLLSILGGGTIDIKTTEDFIKRLFLQPIPDESKEDHNE